MYGRENDGRPVAWPTDASAESRVLADFLTQDVPWTDYAETLTAAGAEITGNAYAVAFSAESVTLTHLHLPDVMVRLPRSRFVAALNEWAAFLREG